MPSNLLKYVPAHTYEEPVFGLGFGGYLRFNYPKLPTGYTKVYGIQINSTIPLGVTPRSSDTDIYIYLGFKVVSVTLNYSSVITTSYVDENSSIVRIITEGTSRTSFYTNLFTKASSPNSFGSSRIDDMLEVLMRKDNDDRFYYSGLTNSKNSYNSLTQEDPTELKLGGSSIVLNLYGLFIRQNGTVLHNWVPCKRNSDNKPGFYNAVNGEFITNENMVVVNS